MGHSRTASASLLLLLSWAQISLIVPSQNGSMPILNDASPVGLIYSTDFENVTKLDANHLNMGINNWFEFEGDGGATMWMEGLDRTTPGFNCHSGIRCVGMELTSITLSRRNEFNIRHLENLVGNELFVSIWLYLPADWSLHAPDDWYELLNPYFTDQPSYLPYGAVHIERRQFFWGLLNMFYLDFDVRDTSGTLTIHKEIPNSLPRGRWFNVQYYVYRDATKGIVRVWIDGTLFWDGRNISTEDPSIAEWFTTPAKIYYDTSDTFSPYRLWVDDLQIYNTQPRTVATPLPAIPGFSWELIIVGVMVGITALAVMRRRRNTASP